MVINDGSSGGTPFRILLTASKTGATNEIVITNNLAANNGTAVQPTFDFGNPVQAASNAQVRLGSGPGALTVQNETNQVDNLIQGVTLNLLNADVNEEIEVRVATNTEPAATAINDLVDTYNAIMDFVDELVRYNPETDQAGLLIGDRTVTDIQNEVRSAVLDVVPGVNGSANRLSSLGISLNNKARLTV
ncbi:flagellar filament capping protein FliD, partial [Planctomicrobium sp.]